MPRSVKPYLQLVRLPNVFTAAADSLAGWLLVGGSARTSRGAGCRWPRPRWSIYAARDRAERLVRLRDRPGRAAGPPAALGAGLAAFAAGLGWGRLVLGPALAALSGSLGAPGRRRAAGRSASWPTTLGSKTIGPRARGHGSLPRPELAARNEPRPRPGRAGGLARRRRLGAVRRPG